MKIEPDVEDPQYKMPRENGAPILSEDDVRRSMREMLKEYATKNFVNESFRSYDRSWDWKWTS